MKRDIWIELIAGLAGYALLFSVDWKVGVGVVLAIVSNNYAQRKLR